MYNSPGKILIGMLNSLFFLSGDLQSIEILSTENGNRWFFSFNSIEVILAFPVSISRRSTDRQLVEKDRNREWGEQLKA